MNAIITKTFLSGNSEAIRLPKAIGFGPGTEVEILRQGNTVTITPVRKTLAWFVERQMALPPATEPWVREPIEFPERDWTQPE